MISHFDEESLRTLKVEISFKRERWRELRELRLSKKNEFLNKGFVIKEIRKQKEYRQLKRKQRQLSKEIRHLEIKLNRIVSKARKR